MFQVRYLFVLLLTLACSGRIADRGESDPSHEAAADAPQGQLPTDLSSVPSVPERPLVESAGTLPLLRLTHREYSNTMRDLLGDTSEPGSEFEKDIPGQTGYDAPSTVATENARQYMTAAETIAARALAQRTLGLPCENPADEAAELACVSQFVTDFGARAYRRPLVLDESEGLLTVYRRARELGFEFRDAVPFVLEAMLQSPNLLYHWEIGDQPPLRDPDDPSLVALTPDQLASRLSYLLWESMPDAALSAAAASGQLATADAVRSQARRLLQDEERARRALFNFHRQWLHIDNLEDLLPGTDLGLLLGQELQTFLGSIFVAGDGTLHSLLTAPYTFVNETTAPEYGLSATGGEFTQVALDPNERQGVLMQVPFLRTNGVAPPVQRGLVIYQRLLCGEVPPPPPVVPELGEAGLTTTTRQRFDEHARQACASGCHALFDPWGFAFENFDSNGRYRSEENGQPIDASGLPQADGTIGGTTPGGVTVPFDGAAELVNALANNDEVSWCTSRHWLRYLLGRFEDAADRGALTNAYVVAAFEADRATPRPFSIRDFLVEFVASKAFRFRTPAEGEPLL